MTEKLEHESVSGFDWDEEKNAINRVKHGIDFEDASEIFFEPIILRRSDRKNEERWTALGQLQDRLIVVAFTWRDRTIRIISARRARKNEKREYRNQKMGRSSQGQD
jgi:uncharacterized DUF497 family protein